MQGQLRRAFAIIATIGLGMSVGCSGSDADDTAVICSQAAALRAPGAVADVRDLWRKAGDGRPNADPRLIEAVDLMQQAVPDQRTLDTAEWNRAHALLTEVCG